MTEDDTKERILQAALAAFTEHGYAAATIADIRKRSGISTGSIYHHYGSKEAVAAALYTRGIRRYQCGFSQALLCARNAEAGVRQSIRFHLDWVGDNPDWARFLLGQGRAEWLRAEAGAITEQNKRFRDAIETWLDEQVAAGSLAPLTPEVVLSLLVGAPQFLVRAWVSGWIAELPRDQADLLADTAWRALRPTAETRKQNQTKRTKRKAPA